MIITYEGTDYEFDQEGVTYQQAMTVQMHTGMSIAEWQDSLDVEEIEDPETREKKLVNPGPEWLKSIGCLYWVVMAQNGVKLPIADMDFKLAKFLNAFGEAQAAESAAEPPERPDPTTGSRSRPPSPEPGNQKAPRLPEEVASTGS